MDATLDIILAAGAQIRKRKARSRRKDPKPPSGIARKPGTSSGAGGLPRSHACKSGGYKKSQRDLEIPGLYNVRPCMSLHPFVRPTSVMDIVIVQENEGISMPASSTNRPTKGAMPEADQPTGLRKIVRYAFESTRQHEPEEGDLFHQGT